MPVDEITTQSGVYQIRHVVSGKVYIGSAVNFRKRWIEHRNRLIRGIHHSRHLQHAWNKYGVDAFVFEIAELVADKADLVRVEQEHMNRRYSWKRTHGYNASPTAGSPLGVKHSAE